METGLRIVTDPDNRRVIHAYDLETGLDLNIHILDCIIHVAPDNITANLNVLVREIDLTVDDHNVTLTPNFDKWHYNVSKK